MARYLVIAADAARASLYVLDTVGRPEDTRPPELVELETMLNPVAQQRASERFSDSRPGLQRRAGSGSFHAVDDHRDRHQMVDEQRFAAELLRTAEKALTVLDIKAIVLAAPPRMLGHLRRKHTKRPGEPPLFELANDLTKLNPTQLHDRLAEKDLLPPRRRLEWN